MVRLAIDQEAPRRHRCEYIRMETARLLPVNVFQKRESFLFGRINIGINSPENSNLGMIIRDVTISVLRV